MAKGKNLNPADAYRKALRKKELKKAKLAAEVERLEFATDPKEKARYAEAKAELDKIYQKKEEYLKEHPEQRRLVYRQKDGAKPDEEILLPSRNFFDKNGLPRHPERSIYYDPVMNPFGVAPPGMPYQERPRQPGEVYSDDSDEDDDDDDVIMPEGPPPEKGEDEEDDSDDDIPMPEGPPPGQSIYHRLQHSFHSRLLLLILCPYRDHSLLDHPFLRHRPASLLITFLRVLPASLERASLQASLDCPPPPPNFPPHGLPLPPAPPGFYPPVRNPSSIQDPLSNIPHQTFQAHRAAHAALPPKPSSVVPPGSASLPPKPVAALESANLMSATVFAAPELRDFKKEATAFVPSNVKRKKAAAATGAASSRVNAAPNTGTSVIAGEESLPARPDLLGSLKGKFGPPPTANTPAAATGKVNAKETQAAKDAKDDYDKFVESMADILGPK
ncbi:Protein saf1 [Mycena sanguinolenta]|uniref:Protein saf1 n=1 Tax=Mycena sanguinolenta TaxID=230812 RepID=A0A8H7CHL4_9AGAR|nr:Protein saf1 [Mycena sanguinolenta]